MDDFFIDVIIINSMKKFLALLIACMIFTTPAYSWGIFSKKKEKQTSENPMENPGYNGDLPDLNKHKTPENKKVPPVYETNEDFGDPATLKPVPRDNPAFVNIILKEDKESQYLNHINGMIPYVERLIDSIENQENEQLFVVKARVFKFKVDHLKTLYDGKSECYYPSYKKLQAVGAHASNIATLRNEAVVYKKYLAYQTTGSVYNPANIAVQLDYLLEELNDTLVVLKEER